MITKQVLFSIDPAIKKSQLNLDVIVESLNNNFKINNFSVKILAAKRQAAFLAQCIHESQHLQRLSENLNYSASGLMTTFPRYFPDSSFANLYAKNPEKIANRVYANEMGNGNETSGDGWKYRGRGLIQLTGRWSYDHCGSGIKQNLIDNPEYLESVEGAVVSSIWFWNSHNLSKLADNDQFIAITKVINPQMFGLEDRQKLYNAALKILQTNT